MGQSIVISQSINKYQEKEKWLAQSKPLENPLEEKHQGSSLQLRLLEKALLQLEDCTTWSHGTLPCCSQMIWLLLLWLRWTAVPLHPSSLNSKILFEVIKEQMTDLYIVYYLD